MHMHTHKYMKKYRQIFGTHPKTNNPRPKQRYKSGKLNLAIFEENNCIGGAFSDSKKPHVGNICWYKGTQAKPVCQQSHGQVFWETGMPLGVSATAVMQPGVLPTDGRSAPRTCCPPLQLSSTLTAKLTCAPVGTVPFPLEAGNFHFTATFI